MEKRNYGIDILRIISVVMITAMHIVKPGMGSYAFENGNLALKIVYAFCSSGVNCFLLISGYVYFCSKQRYSKLIQILMEALFYNLVLTVCVSVINGTLTVSRILKCFMVIGGSNWWFLRTYVGLFLFMPFIINAVKELPVKDVAKSIVAMILFFSLYGTLSGGDGLYLGNGFSVLWFVIVFAIGAFIKRIEKEFDIKSTLCLCLVVGCVILSVASIYVLDWMNMVIYPQYIDHHLFYAYSSPLMLAESIFLLIAFKNIRIRNNLLKKMIGRVTPSVFAVYLIQCQYYVYNFYFPNAFKKLLDYNNRQLILIPFFAIAIFAVCIFIDQFRVFLRRLIHVDDIYMKIDKRLQR